MSGPNRALLVKNAYWLVSEAQYIDYGQTRPFPLRSAGALKGIFAAKSTAFAPDCSMAVTNLYYMSGAKDPTGYGFKGYGNTSSMMSNLKQYDYHYANQQVSLIAAHPGALIVFGVGLPLSQQHVAMVVEQAHDPLVFSHGAAFQTQVYRCSVEQAYHGGGTVCLDVSTL